MTRIACRGLFVPLALVLVSAVANRADAQPAVNPPPELPKVPKVTAKSWAIVDGGTGKLLWAEGETVRRNVASLTKIMTACIVCDLIKADPDILDDIVTVPAQSDKVGGTTAELRAGDQIVVRELLYGLLLPSGNDAAVALAEHFGGRFDAGLPVPGGSGNGGGTSNQERFVSEMNRRAARLGLRQTLFQNPHGATGDEKHLSSARDIAQLAVIALQYPLFRQYVNTRERTATIYGADGEPREVTWRNTNDLLGVGGFDGVKTGTSETAGACLVASVRQGNVHLVIAVLGSSSDKYRYSDAVSLAGWGVMQLQPSLRSVSSGR
jgi:serine-type D-Ala-D-Ala carboxypeptidase (penicillin-binding protein 5/6)